MPIAGRDMTLFIQQLLRERGEPIPADQSLETAKRIKERYSYVCPDIVKEFKKYDTDPDKWIKTYKSVNPVTSQPWQCDVAYERFLAPEIFFSPEMYSSDYLKPLPVLIDEMIQSCPIDTRRGLYGNVVLSGGSTMFKDFDKKLKKDLKKIVDRRIQRSAVDIDVVSHEFQRYAVWFGGSLIGNSPEFVTACVTKEQYEEYGPSICRQSKVFAGV
ncbi:hypothetical protein GUITHDRAFT_109620 [Guillardia theta CCMP2712]|uniref:Actin-related protein 3 n=1 Tax=Guillardia theta (strain CCMP2712) TaxID=905079 RepID=L1J8V5_GUITC|nr:hypothetical protein GUITHDRAFT_109620 [Guillardia theta CCMP2712]EKX44500.1 hypothetical protein GUITHDRAFT_109620 [Guillardia theta CCMP2712]|eukprot:XP_005831480.1 hypothetical protein GUITHDRAFT_109620 [Guillardia theta CCMP2712]